MPKPEPFCAALRSWAPLALALTAVLLLHLHLQNYATVSSGSDTKLRLPQPGEYSVRDLIEALKRVEEEHENLHAHAKDHTNAVLHDDDEEAVGRGKHIAEVHGEEEEHEEAVLEKQKAGAHKLHNARGWRNM